jgi:hypothetical protein
VADDEKFTKPRKCEHCGNVSPMQILFTHSIYKHQYETIEDDTYCRTDEDIYSGFLCPACKQVVLQVLHTCDEVDQDDWFTRTLYPQPETIGKYLPKAIHSAYEAAGKVRRIDANAYAVLLGRVVEIIVRIGRPKVKVCTTNSRTSRPEVRFPRGWWRWPMDYDNFAM